MGIAAATIGNQQIVLQNNEKEHKAGVYTPRSMFAKVTDFLETGEGVFRSTQWLNRVFSWLHAVRPNAAFKETAKVFNGCWTVTAVPHLPFVWKEAKKSIIEAKEPSNNAAVTQRKYGNAVQSTATAAALTGYAFTSFSSIFKTTAPATLPVLKVADALTFVGDVVDLKQQCEDFSQAKSLVGRAFDLNAAPALQTEYAKSQHYYMLKMAKAACSIAGFMLGLGMVATGMGTLPGFVILAASISLLASTLACSANLYKAGMRYQPTDFFDAKQVMPAKI